MSIPCLGRRRSAEHALPILLAAAVGLLTFAAFLPAVFHGFINWDDPHYFLDNPHIRGLGWSNVRWFFTTTYMGHYQPINWLSYAVDYAIGGLDAGQYHRTQVMLHGMVAVCVFMLTSRLAELAAPSLHSHARWLAAAFAGLVFGLHPLRVESVAWAGARADVLATLFYVLAVYAYLGAAAGLGGTSLPIRRLLAVCGLYASAVLCKEMAVTLPVLLIVLDVYPLRRLPASPGRWGDATFRGVWLEKIPFFLIAAAVSVNAFRAAGDADAVASLEQHPVLTRLAQVVVSLAFYPIKTLLPTDLTPLREFPIGFSPAHPLVIVSGAWLAVGACLVVLTRRRAPGLAAAGIAYLILILPVSGIFQRGPQMAAERYSYLACLPIAVLLGYAFGVLFQHRRWAALVLAASIIAALASTARQQLSYWTDSVTLWRRAMTVDPTSGGARAHLAHALEGLGRPDEAEKLYRQSQALGWRHPSVNRNLAAICQRQKRWAEAIEHYQASLRENPHQWDCHYYLAVTYEAVENASGAAEHFAETIKLRPDHVGAHLALGRLLMEHDRPDEAEQHLRQALSLDPAQAEALERLSLLRARAEDYIEAITLLDRCLAICQEMGDTEAVTGLTARRDEFERELRATTLPTTKPRGTVD